MTVRSDNDLMTSGAWKAWAQKSAFHSGILCVDAMPNESKVETNIDEYVMENYKWCKVV